MPEHLALAARLGDDAVTTVEIDTIVAEQARANLSAVQFWGSVRAAGTSAADRRVGTPHR